MAKTTFTGSWRKIHKCCRHGARINNLSDFEERLFWRLNLAADDYGIFHANPRIVRSECVPLLDVTDEQVAEAIAGISRSWLIEVFEDCGEKYLHIIDFERFQTPPNGKKVAKYVDLPCEQDKELQEIILMEDGLSYESRNRILKSMGFNSYDEYLNSSTWTLIRSFAISPHSLCVGCGEKASQVHHLAYHQKVLEGDPDAMAKFTVPLCGKCHEKIEFTNGTKNSLKIANIRLTELSGE